MAKNKFDTNPLDPKFPETIFENETVALPENEYNTSDFPPVSVTEGETNYFHTSKFDSYQMPFDGSNTPVNSNQANFFASPKTSRNPLPLGLSENVMIALPYLPFSIGLIAGVIELLLVPKSEAKIRFHAAQGLAAHLGILLVTTILGGAGKITDFADIGNFIFQTVTLIMLIVFAVKAYKGKPVHIESVENLTNWLEEKINLKK